jgi:hypothetical protein
VRSKLIITAAIGLMAAVTLTVNAESAAHRSDSHRSMGIVALDLKTVSAERDRPTAIEASATPEPSETPKPDVKESSKPDVDARPASTPASSSACATAIANLKSMHQADVSEDASERAAAGSESRMTASTSDRPEDMTEAQNWVNALKAAHSACSPQPLSAMCRSAITGLETVFFSLRQQELSEPQALEPDFLSDFGAVRSAFSAIQMACPDRD